MDFRGKRVLVTGGTRGIGRATVEAFLKAGARVALNGRSEASVASLVEELGACPDLVAAPGDLGRIENCQHVVDLACSQLGGLDVLVNNAGVGGPGTPVEQTTAEDWEATININLRAPYFCIKHAVPALRASHGNIVNISSVSGLRGNGQNGSAYCASKGGLVTLSMDLAIELGPDIRVNCLCPGAVDTEMLQDLGRELGGGRIEEGYRLLSQKAPLRRVASPVEIADAVLFLASDSAGFITGAILTADGGTTAKV